MRPRTILDLGMFGFRSIDIAVSTGEFTLGPITLKI
jgi:hypothetical protein